MDCLIDYIGIEGCGNAASESGYYVNRLLPGIPLESIDKIAQADQVTYLEVWADVQARAAKRFQAEVIRAFQSRYQIQTIQQSIDLLKFIDTVEDQTAAAAKWRGFTIELTPENSQHTVHSALQSIWIQSIKLYRKAVTVAVTGKVFNLETGEVLYTFTIPANTTVGWTTVNIGQRFFAYRIFVAFTATVVASVKMDINQHTQGYFHSCACDCWGYCEARLRGAESGSLSATVFDDDITGGSNTYGLSAVFSIQCSYSSLVCNNKEVFLMPWAYLVAAELMWERIASGRITRWTIGIDKERARELKNEFEARFRQDLDTVLSGIDLDTFDCCLECNAPVQIREAVL